MSTLPLALSVSFSAAHPRKASLDIIALLLNDKRSPDTKRAYAADLKDFFNGEPSPEIVGQFLQLPASDIALTVAQYKSALIDRRLSEATVNRRLAAIKSLLKFAHKLQLCECDGKNLVEGEKVIPYRDTRGVSLKVLQKLLSMPEEIYREKCQRYSSTRRKSASSKGSLSPTLYELPQENIYRERARVKMLRDGALLMVMIENALRRAEVVKLNVGDFDAAQGCLWILGKGRGQQRERVTLSPDGVAAIEAYLDAAGVSGETGEPLFRSLDRGAVGQRLTRDGLYAIVGYYGELAGVKKLTPHKLRHSCITVMLDATKGDVRKVRKLSRHKKVETLLIYDDNREDVAGELTCQLSGMLRKK